MPITLTIKELSTLRAFGVDLFRPVLAADAEAFDIHWKLAEVLPHPLLRVEIWGWLVEARRQNRRVPGQLPN